MVTKKDTENLIKRMGLKGSVICLHSSMKSFGPTESGPATILDPFLDNNITVIAPAFYYGAEANPTHDNYIHNGIDYNVRSFNNPVNYTGSPDQIEKSMGIIPRTMLTYPNVARSKHPMGSFAGLGPKSAEIISNQSLLDIYGPYKKIYADVPESYVIMAGTELTSCTPVHYAEEMAGRRMFRRWAVMDNNLVEFETGGC